VTHPPLKQVATVKKGPSYGDIYLAILPDDAWDVDGNPLHDVIRTRPVDAASCSHAPEFWSSTDRSRGCPTLGLLFHHSQPLEELYGWAVTFRIQELRWEIGDD
jgi:hypothetical protein